MHRCAIWERARAYYSIIALIYCASSWADKRQPQQQQLERRPTFVRLVRCLAFYVMFLGGCLRHKWLIWPIIIIIICSVHRCVLLFGNRNISFSFSVRTSHILHREPIVFILNGEINKWNRSAVWLIGFFDAPGIISDIDWFHYFPRPTPHNFHRNKFSHFSRNFGRV